MPWHPHFCWVFLKLAKKILGVFNRKKKQQNAPKTHKHPGQIRQRDGRNWYWEVRLFLLGKRWDLIVSKCPGFTRVPFLRGPTFTGKTGTPFMEVDISIVPLSLRFIAGYVDWNDLHIDIYIYIHLNPPRVWNLSPLEGLGLGIYIYTVVIRIKMQKSQTFGCCMSLHLKIFWYELPWKVEWVLML